MCMHVFIFCHIYSILFRRTTIIYDVSSYSSLRDRRHSTIGNILKTYTILSALLILYLLYSYIFFYFLCQLKY